MAAAIRKVRIRDLRERGEGESVKIWNWRIESVKIWKNENFSRVGFFALFLNFLQIRSISMDYELWNPKPNQKPENLSLTDPQLTCFGNRIRLLVFRSDWVERVGRAYGLMDSPSYCRSKIPSPICN